MQGEAVRKRFAEIETGIKGTIDFLNKELRVSSFACMPFPSMMVALTSFFATNKAAGISITSNQRKEIMKWFWRSLFSRRYSAGVNKHHESDIAEMQKLKQDAAYMMREFPVNIDESYFIKNQFNVASVNTKAFILMLAQFSPKSFLSGANVDLDEVLKRVNRNEFHHIFPYKYLEGKGVPLHRINCLANFCFISSADNQRIKDKAPTDYKKLIPAATLPEVMEHALCPQNALDLDFDDFLNTRTDILFKKAKELMI